MPRSSATPRSWEGVGRLTLMAQSSCPGKAVWETRSLHQAVQLSGVLADDLALNIRPHAAQVLLDPFLGVGPDPVRVRIVRAPHDVVLADQRDHRADRRLALVRRVALTPPEIARLHGERERVVAVLV